MDIAFVVVRAIHFAACMLLAGELIFVVAIADGAWRRDAIASGALRIHVRIVAVVACIAMLVSGVAWLLFEAASMSGTPMRSVLGEGTAQLVLRETAFGHVFALRGVVFVVLVASLVGFAFARRSVLRVPALAIGLALAAFELVTLAFAGHAGAAGAAPVGVFHIGADIVHLGAASGWVGALPALAYCLARPAPLALRARITRRFSVLGLACVALLIASGIVNTLFLVGSVPALVGTPYGVWLLVKLGLFVVMLGVAWINRHRLTPRLATQNEDAAKTLRRNAIVETVFGIAVVAIVGKLGTMVPGAHEAPVWPFPFTLDLDVENGRLVAWGSALVVAVGIVLIVVGIRRRAVVLGMAGAIALVAPAVVSSSILAVPAFPTTYATSPVSYAVDAVARGGRDFAQHCAPCHGIEGHGDGAEARLLAVKPTNLAEHALHHAPGDLFWWIAHGIRGSPMPAFSPPLSDRSIWQIVQYLIALANAESAVAIGSKVDARSTVEAPDFSYEVSDRGQQTLRGEAVPTLIVLYSQSASVRRLEELADDHRLLHASLRIVPMPMDDNAARAISDLQVDPSAGEVYAMFAKTTSGMQPAHAELLIDAAGVLRARWLGLPTPGADRDAEIADRLSRLPRAPATRTPYHHHGH